MICMDKSTIPAELQAIEFPVWVCWLAQDADGRWWGYEVEPLECDNGWYENEVGRNIQLLQASPTTDWRNKFLRIK